MNFFSLFTAAALMILSTNACSEDAMTWPGGAKVAISLSYDDALDSHLDNAVPALNQYGIKATFYLVTAAESIRRRLPEWRALAEQRHELGNHTLNHACRGSLPGRDWVEPFNDLDQQTVAQVHRDIITANTFLQALDNQDRRTFAAPCDDVSAGGEYYLSAIEEEFLAIRDLNHGMAQGSKIFWGPDGHSGEELIDFVRNNSSEGNLLGIVFHGVGGDYLSVSARAHEELLRFLAENRDIYWIDTYLNIMTHVLAQLE